MNDRLTERIINKFQLKDGSLKVFNYLYDKDISQSQRMIIEGANLPTRVVRYGLKRLLAKNLIIKIPNLYDMRTVYYQINKDILQYYNV